MRYINEVSTEGGPLLIADAQLIQLWRGIEEGGFDYDRACAFFDQSPGLEGGRIPLGDGFALLWEMQGAGTASVHSEDEHLVIVRAWLDDPDDMTTMSDLASLPSGASTDLGDVAVRSGVLGVLWSTETGACIETVAVPIDGRPTGEMSSHSAGLLISCRAGVYHCIHDVVIEPGGNARRCHLKLTELNGAPVGD